MKVPLWGVRPGPEWDESVEAADPRDGYFQDDLQAAYDALELDPFKFSTTFLGEAKEEARVFTTKDVVAGYRVFVFFKILRGKQTVELGWVELEPLEEV